MEETAKNPEISVILPCLDEQETIGACIDEAKKAIIKYGLDAEIVVADNGSSDGSLEIIKSKNVILVVEFDRGYGSACLKGLETAKGKYLFLADSDGTYDFKEIPAFIEELKKGSDFVIGNRFKGKMEKGAMPFKNRYIGNPVLSGILRLFFSAKIGDSQSGMRAITKDAFKKLDLRTTGMEFASEMIVQALKNNLKIKELPINYYRRKGLSKLRPFSDAWKHLRFMLLYSPLFLFFIPGTVLLLAGIISMGWLYFGNASILGIRLYYHPMFFSSALIIAGYQLVFFSAFTKSYLISRFGDRSERMEKLYKFITIERASMAGILIMLAGGTVYLLILQKWIGSGFGSLGEIKNSIVALTLIVLGVQTISSSFMLSILGIREKSVRRP